MNSIEKITVGTKTVMPAGVPRFPLYVATLERVSGTILTYADFPRHRFDPLTEFELKQKSHFLFYLMPSV